MYNNFSIKELAQLNQSIASYLELSGLFLSAEPEVLTWREKAAGPLKLDWASSRENWSRINIYCFTQMWSSTAGGWGGVGGCAMTEYYTVVIQNPFGMLAVFWSGKFAYAVEDDEQAMKYLHQNSMPGFESHPGRLDKLKVIYKSGRK